MLPRTSPVPGKRPSAAAPELYTAMEPKRAEGLRNGAGAWSREAAELEAAAAFAATDPLVVSVGLCSEELSPMTWLRRRLVGEALLPAAKGMPALTVLLRRVDGAAGTLCWYLQGTHTQHAVWQGVGLRGS